MVFLHLCVVFLSVLQVIHATATGPATPQFHLSLVGDGTGDYMLDWVTSVDGKVSTVFLGTSKEALSTKIQGISAGNVLVTPDFSVQCWSARISNVKTGSTVFYDLIPSAGATTKSFVANAGSSITWAIFGDMASNALKKASGITLIALQQDLEANVFQGIVNIGDLAYELIEGNGNQYMQQLEPITSAVPMHTTIGNHEMQWAAMGAMKNYYRRFAGQISGAGMASGSSSNRFYSFNAGYIHFVVIDTEVYGDEAFMTPGDDGLWRPSEEARSKMQEEQKNWLEYDLSRVKRKSTPFVVLCGHRPPSKMPNSVTRPGNQFAMQLLPLIDQYKVDLMFFGHEHAYYSVEAAAVGKYTLPPFIITGAAGNNEFIRPVSKVNMDATFKVRKNINEYGYGYLKATVEKLIWTWGQAATSSPNGESPSSMAWKLMDTVEYLKKDIADSAPSGKAVNIPATPSPSTNLASSSPGSPSSNSSTPTTDKNSGSSPSPSATGSTSNTASTLSFMCVATLLTTLLAL